MDAVAKQEARSRSELLREGVRLYLERKRRWEHIFTYWHRAARQAGLKPQDVGPLIAEVRARRRVS
jgi:Arc/MetJ-type ribon-helix-helix transcriptional regulator